MYSYQSDHGVAESPEELTDTGVEKFEDKLMQAIENASEKSQQTRTQALQVIAEILMHHCMFDFIDERRVTIM